MPKYFTRTKRASKAIKKQLAVPQANDLHITTLYVRFWVIFSQKLDWWAHLNKSLPAYVQAEIDTFIENDKKLKNGH